MFDKCLPVMSFLHRVIGHSVGQGKVLYQLGHSPVRPEFRIEYMVVEPDETYNIDINSDDIDVTDNVMVVWGIK